MNNNKFSFTVNFRCFTICIHLFILHFFSTWGESLTAKQKMDTWVTPTNLCITWICSFRRSCFFGTAVEVYLGQCNCDQQKGSGAVRFGASLKGALAECGAMKGLWKDFPKHNRERFGAGGAQNLDQHILAVTGSQAGGRWCFFSYGF